MKKLESAFLVLGVITMSFLSIFVLIEVMFPLVANIGWVKVSGGMTGGCEVYVDGQWETVNDVQYMNYTYKPARDINILEMKDANGDVLKVVSPEPIKYWCVG